MNDRDKTKNQLIDELIKLRQRITELETSEAEDKQVEKVPEYSEKTYQDLVDNAVVGIYKTNLKGDILYVNKTMAKMFEFNSPEEMMQGGVITRYKNPKDREVLIENLKRTGKVNNFEIEVVTKTKKLKHVLLNATLEGCVISGMIMDLTERKQMEEKLYTLSLTDELTGLYNRRGFFTLVGHLLKTAKRQKQRIFMLYADLDDLKCINDTLGHKEGDNALIAIADVFKKSFRESDIIARMGGDEFVAIPVGITGDRVEIVTARLQKQLDIYNIKSTHRCKLSMSVGITCYDPELPCSIDELLTQADKLMYEQKRHKQKS